MPDHERQPADHDFAWRVHAAIQDWTKNVDQKASITLAIITAVGGFAANQVFGQKGSLHAVHGDQMWPMRAMMVFSSLRMTRIPQAGSA